MFLYLSGIILAFFLSFVLFTKRRKTDADHILVAWLCTTGLHLLTFYLFSTGQYDHYASLIVFGFSLPLAQGPFLYLYTRRQTSSTRFTEKELLHFLPVLASSLLFTKFHLLDPVQKVAVFREKGAGFETQLLVNGYTVYLSGVLYIGLSFHRLVQYKKSIIHQFSNTEKINFNWLRYLILWMLAIWIVVIILQEDRLVFASAALFVLWLGYFSIRQVQVFSQPANTPGQLPPLENNNDIGAGEVDDNTGGLKYQRSFLTDEYASTIHERLMFFMTEEKPFTNPDLTLNELAKNLEVHPNYLSQVINSRENRSFYDLINQKRVEEFIQLSASSSSQQFTLLSIAYDCGFNSKASFNRNFKKYVGKTPSDYLKEQLLERA